MPIRVFGRRESIINRAVRKKELLCPSTDLRGAEQAVPIVLMVTRVFALHQGKEEEVADRALMVSANLGGSPEEGRGRPVRHPGNPKSPGPLGFPSGIFDFVWKGGESYVGKGGGRGRNQFKRAEGDCRDRHPRLPSRLCDDILALDDA